MSPPPPRPDDEPTPSPAAGWEPVEPSSPPAPARDPLLDDPLFAELVEDKPLPDLTVEPVAPLSRPAAGPVRDAGEDLPVAEPVHTPRAAPVAPPRRRSEEPRPVAPPPQRRAEDVPEPPKPRWFAACSVLGCFGLGLAGALGFLAYAAVLMMSTIADNRPGTGGHGGSVRPDAVAPTAMTTQKATIPLPGIVDAVGRAAGGRFLLMRIARTGEIAVLDPNTGLLGKSFEPGASGALFAGSASKLFVYKPTPDGGELQRWDLSSGEREATSSLPPGVLRPDVLTTGAGVDGRVYLVNLPENGTATLRALNPTTLAQEGPAVPINTWKGGRGKTHVRASDDGTVLGVTSADGALVVRVPKAGATTAQKLSGLNGKTPPLAFPAPDGRAVYSPGGVFDPEKGRRKAFGTPYAFPTAVGSGLFLSLDRDPDLNTLSEPLTLHLAANPSLSVAVQDVDVPRGLKAIDAGDVSLPPDQRIHLWPAAGLAAVIPTPDPGGKQRLEVRKVDVPKLLREIDKPYLVFGTEPRLWAVRGAEWKYRPDVWTPPGQQVTFSLVNFPEGMRYGPRNELTWTPQAGQGNAEVVIRVESGDLAAEQSFRVALVEPDHGQDPDDHDDE